MSIRAVLPCLIGVITFAAACSLAGESGPLRERMRERLVERAGQKIAAEAPPATLLKAGAPITAPGRYEIRLRHGGQERMALIHVPRSWLATGASPLVMA